MDKMSEAILNSLKEYTEDDAKLMTVILPNAVKGCSWEYLSADVPELLGDNTEKVSVYPKEDCILVEANREDLYNIIKNAGDSMPKLMLSLFNDDFKSEATRFYNDLTTEPPSMIRIYSTSTSPYGYFNGNLVPEYRLNLDMVARIMIKCGYEFLVSGKAISPNAVLTEDGKRVFIKMSEIGAGGKTLLVRLVKK